MPGLLRCALIVVATAALVCPPAAFAAFPGTNGRIAFVSDRDSLQSEIYSSAANGSDVQRLTANLVADTDPALSPDGKRIAFAREQNIWVMNADGSAQTAVTGLEGSGERDPAWSRDGTKIVFVSNRSTPGGGTTGPQLWVMDADGQNVRQLTGQGPANQAPVWSPTADVIAFHSNSDGEFEIYTIDANSTPGSGTDSRVKLTTNNLQDQNPSWSPNGTKLAFERGSGTNVGDDTKQIWVMDASGSNPVELTPANTDYDVQPAWSPDGSTIAFESDADGDREIFSMPATAGASATNLTSTTSGIADGQPDWGIAVAAADPGTGPDPGTGTGPGPGPGTGTGTDPGAGADPKGGHQPSCQEKVSFGVIEAIGCFERSGDDWLSTGTVWVNGLAFVPVGGAARLLFDPKGQRLDSRSSEFELWVGASMLKRGRFDWSLAPVGGVAGAVFGAGSGSQLGKLPATGDIRVEFARGVRAIVRAATRMPFFEALQRFCAARCPSVTADVIAITDNKTGLQQDGLELSARNVLLGGLVVERFDATWIPAAGRWQGEGMLLMPSPTPLRARVTWVTEANRLVSATASLRSIRTPISFGVFLERLDMALSSNPLQLTGQLALTAGPNFRGTPPIGLDGSFTFRPGGFLRGDYLRAEGQTRLFDFPLSSGHVQIWPGGAFDFGLRLDLGIPFGPGDPRRKPVYVGAKLNGWLVRNSVGAEATAEVLVFGQRTSSAEVVVSNTAWAACGQLGWLRGGVAQRRGEQPVIMAGSCDVGPYRARKSLKAAQAGPLTVRLADSDRGGVLRFRGEGGPPQVILEGPRGQRVAAPADGSPVLNSGFVVLQDPSSSSTHVAIRRPGGSWRVSVPEGSPAVTGVESADVLEAPSVSARLSGKGAKRTLTWRLSGPRGQRVTFTETGSDSARVIKSTKARAGRVRFAPAPGTGRARKIVAVIEQGGVPRDSRTVASYKAPPWRKPARTKRLRVRRKASSLVVSWGRTASAARYLVYVTAADGEREAFLASARKRRLTVRGVAKDDRATVQVLALRSDNAAGKPATVRLKPVKRRRARGR